MNGLLTAVCPSLTGSKAAPVGIGSKAGGIGSAAPPQAPADGENVLTKMLPGAAAEQAGKLGDGELLSPHTACVSLPIAYTQHS